MRRLRAIPRWLALGVILALVAAACSSGGDNADVTTTADAGTDAPTTTAEQAEPTTTEAPDPEPAEPTGFTYRTAIFEDLTTDNYWAYLDPESSVWNGYVFANHARGMFQQQPPDNTLVPDLALGLPEEPVQDGDTWVITQPMRQGLVWSDGEPIDAHDVAFTANAVMDLGLGGNWLQAVPPATEDDPATDANEYRVGLLSVTALDDYTVEYVFNGKPGLSIWQFGVGLGSVLPEHFWAEAVNGATAPEDLYAASGVGAPSAHGYMFDAWESGAFARNVRNSNYSFAGQTHTFHEDGAYSTTVDGLGIDETYYGDGSAPEKLSYTDGPYADDILYSIYATQDTAVLALAEGEVDFMLNSLGLQRGLVGLILENPDLNLIQNPNNGYRYVAFNLRRPPMDQLAFRQAVACMIDRDFMANNVLQGVAIPAWSQVPEGNAFWYDPSTPILCDGLTPQQRLEQSVQFLKDGGFTWDVEPGWDPDNLDAIPKGEGLRDPNGNLLEDIELIAPGPGYDPLRATYSLFIEDWANDLGIPIVAEPTGFNVIVDKVFTDDPQFDMYMLGWTLTPFPNHLVNFFESSQDTAVSGGNNTPGYNNPAYDELAAAFQETTDLERARDLVSQMDKILAEDLPYIVLFTTPILEAHRNTLEYPFTESLSGIQNLQGLPLSVTSSD